MKNRIIALLIVLTIVLACFASCGGGSTTDDNKNPGTDTPGGDNPGPVTPGPDKPVTNPEYPWTTTTLIFSISENSDNQQLPSSSRRYLAGDLSQTQGGGDKVDTYVSDRNSDALSTTNVTIDYRYLPDTDVYGYFRRR